MKISSYLCLLFALAWFPLSSEENTPPQKDPRVLILIIASENHPVYSELQKVWESYMNSDPEHVTAYFLKADPLLDEKCKIVGNTIYSKVIDGYRPGILLKTVYALEKLEPDLNKYDYIVRTNLSTVFHFPRLLAYLNALPKERCYAGRILDHNWDKTRVYVQGCGIIFSRDVVQGMMREKEYIIAQAQETPDDVVMGDVIRNQGVPIIQFPYYSFTSRDVWLKQKNKLPNDAFLFRVRNYFLLHNPQYYRDIAYPYDEELFIAADMVKTFYEGTDLKKEYQSTYPLHIPLITLYEYYAAFTSDLNEHLPPLRDLARQCKTITEISSKSMCTTWALLQGLADKGTEGSYEGRFFETPPLTDLLLADKLSKEHRISFAYSRGNDRFFDIKETDLLFIHALCTYPHLTFELEKFSPGTKKYIVIHGTSGPFSEINDPAYKGNFSEYLSNIDKSKAGLWPAVQDFLTRHPEWSIKEKLTNNGGLTVLQRGQ